MQRFWLGAASALLVRAAVPRVAKLKTQREMRRLNAGDYGPMLANFAEDAVLVFNEGPHRFSGTHRGKPAIERFLQQFVAAGVQGEIGSFWLSGPPWNLEVCFRFDDAAHAADGEQLYANSTVIWCRTRWGKVVEQRDFYEDTERIVAFSRRLDELGIHP